MKSKYFITNHNYYKIIFSEQVPSQGWGKTMYVIGYSSSTKSAKTLKLLQRRPWSRQKTDDTG